MYSSASTCLRATSPASLSDNETDGPRPAKGPRGLTRLATLVLLAVAVPAAPAPPPGEPIHAVEFPYYLYPRPLWARALLWLKPIGGNTVVFSIPWNWH